MPSPSIISAQSWTSTNSQKPSSLQPRSIRTRKSAFSRVRPISSDGFEELHQQPRSPVMQDPGNLLSSSPSTSASSTAFRMSEEGSIRQSGDKSRNGGGRREAAPNDGTTRRQEGGVGRFSLRKVFGRSSEEVDIRGGGTSRVEASGSGRLISTFSTARTSTDVLGSSSASITSPSWSPRLSTSRKRDDLDDATSSRPSTRRRSLTVLQAKQLEGGLMMDQDGTPSDENAGTVEDPRLHSPGVPHRTSSLHQQNATSSSPQSHTQDVQSRPTTQHTYTRSHHSSSAVSNDGSRRTLRPSSSSAVYPTPNPVQLTLNPSVTTPQTHARQALEAASLSFRIAELELRMSKVESYLFQMKQEEQQYPAPSYSTKTRRRGSTLKNTIPPKHSYLTPPSSHLGSTHRRDPIGESWLVSSSSSSSLSSLDDRSPRLFSSTSSRTSPETPARSIAGSKRSTPRPTSRRYDEAGDAESKTPRQRGMSMGDGVDEARSFVLGRVDAERRARRREVEAEVGGVREILRDIKGVPEGKGVVLTVALAVEGQEDTGREWGGSDDTRSEVEEDEDEGKDVLGEWMPRPGLGERSGSGRTSSWRGRATAHEAGVVGWAM